MKVRFYNGLLIPFILFAFAAAGSEQWFNILTNSALCYIFGYFWLRLHKRYNP